LVDRYEGELHQKDEELESWKDKIAKLERQRANELDDLREQLENLKGA